MKKKVFGRKLGRERDSRKALFRGLTRSLVEHGKIRTTLPKAKAIQPDIDRLVNLAKVPSTASLRRLYAYLGNDKGTAKLLKQVAPNFDKRKSGYTRITKIGVRRGDLSPMVFLEWVERVTEKAKETGKPIEGPTKDKKETKKDTKTPKRLPRKVVKKTKK